MKKVIKRLTVGYVRSAVKDDLAIEKQKETIKKYCEEQLLDLDRIISDNGLAGNNLNRPGLQQLLKKVSNFDISKVICVDLSRLSRNTFESLYLKSYFDKHETDLITVNTPTLGKEDPISKTMEEMMTVVNSIHPRTHHQEPKEQPISVDKQSRFKRHVKISVSEKDLNNTSKFKKMLKDESFYGCTCGLYRSQIVLIAKILRLNLENTTEVKAEIQF